MCSTKGAAGNDPSVPPSADGQATKHLVGDVLPQAAFAYLVPAQLNLPRWVAIDTYLRRRIRSSGWILAQGVFDAAHVQRRPPGTASVQRSTLSIAVPQRTRSSAAFFAKLPPNVRPKRWSGRGKDQALLSGGVDCRFRDHPCLGFHTQAGAPATEFLLADARMRFSRSVLTMTQFG